MEAIETKLNQLYREFYHTLGAKERAQVALTQINQAIAQLEQQKQQELQQEQEVKQAKE